MVAIVFEFSRVCFDVELARYRATIELLGALSTNPPGMKNSLKITVN